jgi:hypothetical protein
MMFENRGNWLALLLIGLALAALTGLIWVNAQFVEHSPGGIDFLARWMGARYWLKEGISPYDKRVSLASQQMIYGRAAKPAEGEDVAHFVYPLHSMVFFGPFGLLEFSAARTLWMTLLEFSLAGLAVVSVNLLDWKVSSVKLVFLVLFSLLWYYGVRTIIVGQFAGLNASLIAMVLLLILRGQDTGAGFLLALATAKPQMVFLLVPFIILWALSVRRRQIIFGFLAAFGLMMVVCLLLIPRWPLQMYYQLMDYLDYTSIGSPLSMIAGAAPGIENVLHWGLYIIVIGYLILEWFLAWGKGERWFVWTALLTVVVTNLVAFRGPTTNYVMMLPALFFIFKLLEDRWADVGRVAVVGWLVILFGGLWALSVVTVEENVEGAIMDLLPPFFCLLGLWWVRWWAINPPRLHIEGFVRRSEPRNVK